jgi:hypothetical protein
MPVLAANITRHCDYKHKNITRILSEGEVPVKSMY